MRLFILSLMTILSVLPLNSVLAQSSNTAQEVSIPIDFARLVASLKSRNEAPKITGSWEVRFAPDFAFSEQRRVAKALSTLQKYAEESWPFMVENLTNTEYAITLEFGSNAKNLTVAQVCEQIIHACLYEFHDRCTLFLEDTDVTVSDIKDPQLADLRGLQSWLGQRQQKSLLELQIELCQDLKKRIQGLKMTAAAKTRLSIFVDEQLAHMQRRGYPETGTRFIPNHEVTWFFERRGG